MKTLKLLDLSNEQKLLSEINDLQKLIDEKAKTLVQMLDEKAHEYYGDCGFRGFLKENSHTYITEDGYKVAVEGYLITISKELPAGTLFGSGTIYDKEWSDLSFHIQYKSGRYVTSFDKKYADLRQRMVEIQEAVKIFDPFKEYRSSDHLHFFGTKYLYM